MLQYVYLLWNIEDSKRPMPFNRSRMFPHSWLLQNQLKYSLASRLRAEVFRKHVLAMVVGCRSHLLQNTPRKRSAALFYCWRKRTVTSLDRIHQSTMSKARKRDESKDNFYVQPFRPLELEAANRLAKDNYHRHLYWRQAHVNLSSVRRYPFRAATCWRKVRILWKNITISI